MILDLVTPGVSAYRVLKQVRASPEPAGTPATLLTGGTDDEDALEGYGDGANHYLSKPFTAEQPLCGIGIVRGQARG